MRQLRLLTLCMLIPAYMSGCATTESTTIGGHTFNSIPCALIGAAVGASAGGAAGGAGGALGGALGGVVISQLFCGGEPEVADSDGDGVADDLDQCPGTPAGVPVDETGCAMDTDRDGIPDYLDQCHQLPGDEEHDGCPPDSDGDGFRNDIDSCPLEPAPDSADGCPEPASMFIESIHFDFDSAVIKPVSKAVLDARAVPIMRNNPGLKVRVEGHTDSVGPERYNQLLSLRRAQAVRDYLVSQGIDETRLSIAGYGESDPIDGNETRAGRANNRRVEFVIR